MRRSLEKTVLGGVAALALAAAGAVANSFTRTYPLGQGTVAVTNEQANSSWVPVAVMFQYAGPSSGTADVVRASQNVDVLLGRRSFSNKTSVVWVPDAPYAFGHGDALVIFSSETNGVVQIIRRGE